MFVARSFEREKRRKEKNGTPLNSRIGGFVYFSFWYFIPYSSVFIFCLVISLSSVGTRSTCTCVCVSSTSSIFQTCPCSLSLSLSIYFLLFFPSSFVHWLKLKFSQQLKHIPYNIHARNGFLCVCVCVTRSSKKRKKMSNVCCYCVSRILPVVCRWERFLLNRKEWRCVNSGSVVCFFFFLFILVLNSQNLIFLFDMNVQVPMGLERWILRPVRPLSWLQTRLLQRQPVAVHLRDQLGWHPLRSRYYFIDYL